MALQFEVDSLDGVDESQKALYAEHEGKFRLQVEGIDPADELKEALRKEREEKRLADEQRKRVEAEAEREKKEAERLRLESEGKHKEAAELANQQLKDLQTQMAQQEADRVNEKLDNAALTMAASATYTANDAKILARFIKDELDYGDSGVVGKNGATQEQVLESMRDSGLYSSLFKAVGSSGGGAQGGSSTPSRKPLAEMNDAERIEFKNRDPDGFTAAIKGK